jgi:hypothetical protein
MKRTSSLFSLVLILSLLLMLTTFVVAGASAPNDGPWVYSTDLPAVAVRSDTEFYNGKMYMLGYRTDGAGTTDGSVWVYDAALNTWSDTGVDMPVPVSNYTIAKLTDGTGVGLYIFGGRDSTGACTTTVQVYYPDTNTTATIATDAWAGTVNGATVFPGGVVAVNNKAYAWGGFCGGTTSPYTGSQTWIFDPAAAAGSRWTAGPTLPAPGAYQNGAALDGKIYSIGGDSYDGSVLIAYADVLMLDPANLGAGWQTKAPILTPSSGAPGCDESRAFGFDTASSWSLAGKIVLAGCGQWDQTPTALPESFVYDGASNTWATFASLNQARRNHAGAFIVDSATSGRMWVGGGYVPDGTNVGTATTETYQVGTVPTAVSLTGFSANASASARLPWLALGGALLIVGAAALARHRLA